MTTISVDTPWQQDIFPEYTAALEIRQEILDHIEDGPVRLDFSDVEWIETAELTPIACLVNQLKSQGYEIEVIEPEDSWVRNWFQAINFPDGTTDPPRWMVSNQLPLLRIDAQSDTDIDLAMDRIGELVRRQVDSSISPIMYALGEIIDNVNEHSQSDVAFVMVQNYPSHERIDLCITDNGIGIPGNYQEHGIDFTDDQDAVRMAFEEGVSTKSVQRGYGIRTTARLVCEGLGGEVLLSSSDGLIHRREANSRLMDAERWDGTTFIARLYPPEESFDLYDYVE